MYSLNKDIFETSMLDIIREKSDEADAQAQRDAVYRQKVIDAFFEYGKLKAIPAQRKKERIILDVIVQEFEYDRILSARSISLLPISMMISARSAGIWSEKGWWTGTPEGTGV